MFLHQDDYTDINMERWQNVFSLDDLQQQVQQDVSNYYSLKDDSGDMLDRYLPRMQTDTRCFMNGTKPVAEELCPVRFEATYIRDHQ
jgi:hypothetical protein